MHPLDLAPLDAPLSRDEVADYRRSSRAAGVPRLDATMPGWRSALTTVLMVVVTPIVLAATVVLTAQYGVNGKTVAGWLVVLIFVAGAGLYLAKLRWPRIGGSLLRHRLLMSRFAAANRGRYSPRQARPPRQGFLFGVGERGEVYDQIEFSRHPRVEVANYTFVVSGARGSETHHHWAYLSVELDRVFPHIVLDSRANNGVRGAALPVPFKGGAVQLEGDFHRHFTLYCPPGYETDARYLLTPDLMATLIDEGADFDLEIIDNLLFLYCPRPLDLSSRETWQRIDRLLATIGADTRGRTVRYADERVGDRRIDQVAAKGRRIPQWSAGLIIGAIVGISLLALVVLAFMG